MRQSLALLLKVPYRAGYMLEYPGDQGGQDHWVSGNPSDAQVAECLVPLYPPQGAVKSPTTRMLALPVVGLTRRAYVHGKQLLEVNLYEKMDQQFEDYATPWELLWSDLSYPYNRGFTPIVDRSWAVIGHLGSFQGGPRSEREGQTSLILPSEYAGRMNLDAALAKGVPVFVHSSVGLPPGWANGNCYTCEDRIQVITGLDGEVIDFRLFNTGSLVQPWFSPLDFYDAAKVVVSLTRIGGRLVTTLVRKATVRLEARAVLKGATKALARDAAKSAAKDEAKQTGGRALLEADLKPLVRRKGTPSRVLTPAQMETFLRDTLKKRPYLAKLRSVAGNDGLLGIIKEWEKNTGKSFLKVTKGAPARLGSEGVGGWALDSISGKEVMIIEGEVFRNERGFSRPLQLA
jgi:hypothetical protein